MKLNAVLNALKGIMGIVFPIITFPYAARILGVNELGRYNYSASIISYFVLIAGLGINSYAIREGAKIRDSKEKLSILSSELFTINLISTVISYLLLAILVILDLGLKDYITLIAILSITILFKTIGVEWLYSIYEEYTYITVRSIIFQIISLVLLFAMVHSKADTNKYALISVISSVGANVLNIYNSRKYIRIKLVNFSDIKKHTKPILMMFVTAVTITIYVSSDTTMLGAMCGDRAVGLYSVSAKLYTIMKTILSSVLIVSIPRISSLINDTNNAELINKLSLNINELMYSILLPAAIGIIMVRKELIYIIAGIEYQESELSVVLLSIALIFCMGAYFWGQCILIPLGKEKELMYITLLSAIVNITSNVLLIPSYQQNAAAFTTIIAEGIAFVSTSHIGRKVININGLQKTLVKIFIGCIGVILTCIAISKLHFPAIIEFVLQVLISALVYCVIEILIRNKAIHNIINSVLKRVNKI
ncbi:flippase [Butyrivibrio sp. AE2015]|uniref:flippase n=1 Tax=Butyrivibrio sp. AE2015 TaxID=1280663 RepID=UPI0018CAA800|nr:flippase [Butyrivibrio sp. AE2015]